MTLGPSTSGCSWQDLGVRQFHTIPILGRTVLTGQKAIGEDRGAKTLKQCRRQESVTTDKRGIGEVADLPEWMPGGDLLEKQQDLEFQLLEAQAQQRGDSSDLANILHQLGLVIAQTGDLETAMQHLEKSLRMKQSLHGAVSASQQL